MDKEKLFLDFLKEVEPILRGASPACRDSLLRIRKAFYNANERTRQETFKITSDVLKGIIERIKGQSDIYWNTGGDNKSAYVLPKNIVKQFEITLNTMEEIACASKQEKGAKHE